jgi:hypothetical protein
MNFWKNIFHFNSFNSKYKDYLAINQCSDKASESDCKRSASQGLCDVVLFNSIKLSDLCPKSCNKCTLNTYMTCDNVVRNCTCGQCLPITLYQSVSTIQCLCPYGYGGYYCQQSSVCDSINPCQTVVPALLCMMTTWSTSVPVHSATRDVIVKRILSDATL